MDDIAKLRDKYHRLIEDGNEVLEFATQAGWQWYVNTVLNPTIDEYTAKILEGKLDDRQDLVMKGYVNALKMVVDSTTTFMDSAEKAREDSRKLEEDVKNG